jgi:hypothetical protein
MQHLERKIHDFSHILIKLMDTMHQDAKAFHIHVYSARLPDFLQCIDKSQKCKTPQFITSKVPREMSCSFKMLQVAVE